MRPIFFVTIGFVASLALGACGASTAQAPTAPASSTAAPPTVAPAPTSAPVPTAPAPTSAPVPTTASAAPSAVPSQPVQDGDDPIVSQARAALLAQPGLGQQTLSLQDVKQVDWPDSALGCPQAGSSYLQVITPGLQITFSDGARTYEIHTTLQGDPLIWCDAMTPKVIGGSQ